MWGEPNKNHDNCYFCLAKVFGYSAKNKDKITYPLIPVLHSELLPIPKSPNGSMKNLSDNDGDISIESSNDPEYLPQTKKLPPPQHFVQQAEWRYLDEKTRKTKFRRRNATLSTFFAIVDSICVCKDIEGLMKEIGFINNTSEWRLFIDSSNTSLKAY